MKKVFNVVFLLITGISFSACSNMSVGFEEGSVFYTPPEELQEKSTQVIKVQETNTKDDKSENITTQNSINEKDSENETTFSYDPYDGE